MDITSIFKANVKAIKIRNKLINNSSDDSLASTIPELDKNRILQKHRKKDEFSKIFKDVLKKITELRNFLIEHRPAYMKYAQHLKSSPQMTDEERDIIDTESEKFFIFYTQYIGKIRSDWRRQKMKKQYKEHIENVLELLENYLKGVNNLHSEQKKYRINYDLENYRFLKLASDKKLRELNFETTNKKSNEAALSENDEENYDNEYNYKNQIQKSLEPKDEEGKKMIDTQQIALDDDNDLQNKQQLNNLSPEDIQMFEQENNQIFQELQGLSEEVEQIEKNVIDIAKLQEVFTEKVVLQKHDIERISNAVVGATENVKDANEQIKQAIQRNAGLRVWALFFLLVMSFTLLFLDWYND